MALNPTYADKEVGSLDFHPHKNGDAEKDNRSAINIRSEGQCYVSFLWSF